jgi:hypothetical protein
MYVLAKNAFFAEAGISHNMRKMPNLRAFTDLARLTYTS